MALIVCFPFQFQVIAGDDRDQTKFDEMISMKSNGNAFAFVISIDNLNARNRAMTRLITSHSTHLDQSYDGCHVCEQFYDGWFNERLNAGQFEFGWCCIVTANLQAGICKIPTPIVIRFCSAGRSGPTRLYKKEACPKREERFWFALFHDDIIMTWSLLLGYHSEYCSQ
jgi:hypothetical protein